VFLACWEWLPEVRGAGSLTYDDSHRKETHNTNGRTHLADNLRTSEW